MSPTKRVSLLSVLLGGAAVSLASIGCGDDGTDGPRGAAAGTGGSSAGTGSASAGTGDGSPSGEGGTGGSTSTGKGGGPTVPGLRAEPGWLPYGSTAAGAPVLRMSAGRTYYGAPGPLRDALAGGCVYRDEGGNSAIAAVTTIASTGGNDGPSLELVPASPLAANQRWMLTCSVPASVATVSLSGHSAPSAPDPSRFDLVFSTGSAPTVIDATHGTVAAKTASLSITLSELVRGGDLAGTRLTLGGVVVEGVCPNRGSSGKGTVDCLQPDDDRLCGGFGMTLPPGVASGGDLPLGLLFPANAKGPGGASFGEATQVSSASLGPRAILQGDDVAFTFAPGGWTYGKDSASWRADIPLLAVP